MSTHPVDITQEETGSQLHGGSDLLGDTIKWKLGQKKKDSVDMCQGIEIGVVRANKRFNLRAVKENCINYEKFELCHCFCTEN